MSASVVCDQSDLDCITMTMSLGIIGSVMASCHYAGADPGFLEMWFICLKVWVSLC